MTVPGRSELCMLLAERFASLTGADRSAIGADTRLIEDLHADSLDVVEVLEDVERWLRGRRVTGRVGDQQLAAVRTVGELAERLHTAARRST